MSAERDHHSHQVPEHSGARQATLVSRTRHVIVLSVIRVAAPLSGVSPLLGSH